LSQSDRGKIGRYPYSRPFLCGQVVLLGKCIANIHDLAEAFETATGLENGETNAIFCFLIDNLPWTSTSGIFAGATGAAYSPGFDQSACALQKCRGSAGDHGDGLEPSRLWHGPQSAGW